MLEVMPQSMLTAMLQPMLRKAYTMKLLISTLIACVVITPAFAGILDGKPADPEKRARPGGYYEQVKNLKSLASCASVNVYDEYGNFLKKRCPN